VAPKKFFSISC